MYGRALGKRRIDVLTTPRDLPVEKGAGALDAQLDETAPASSIEATAPAVRGCVVRECVVESVSLGGRLLAHCRRLQCVLCREEACECAAVLLSLLHYLLLQILWLKSRQLQNVWLEWLHLRPHCCACLQCENFTSHMCMSHDTFAHMHACMHASLRTYMRARMYVCTFSCRYVCKHAYKYACKKKSMYACIH